MCNDRRKRNWARGFGYVQFLTEVFLDSEIIWYQADADFPHLRLNKMEYQEDHLLELINMENRFKLEWSVIINQAPIPP